MIVFSTCFSASVYLASDLWCKWDASQILISIETTDSPNGNHAFPAVSICNVNKVSKHRLETYLRDKYGRIIIIIII